MYKIGIIISGVRCDSFQSSEVFQKVDCCLQVQFQLLPAPDFRPGTHLPAVNFLCQCVPILSTIVLHKDNKTSASDKGMGY